MSSLASLKKWFEWEITNIQKRISEDYNKYLMEAKTK